MEYVEVAEDFLRRAREELKGGDVRQATEKVWGAAALAVKAYAKWREGRRLVSHGELWEYRRIILTISLSGIIHLPVGVLTARILPE